VDSAPLMKVHPDHSVLLGEPPNADIVAGLERGSIEAVMRMAAAPSRITYRPDPLKPCRRTRSPSENQASSNW
jgi:hypothetical protein